MLLVTCQVDHVSDDELGHDLDHIFGCELALGATLGQEAKSVLEKQDESLIWVDLSRFKLELLRLGVKLLNFALEWLTLTKVKWQPMGEALILDRAANLLLGESLQAEQVERGLDASDLACAWQSRNADTDAERSLGDSHARGVANEFFSEHILGITHHDKCLWVGLTLMEGRPGLDRASVTALIALKCICLLDSDLILIALLSSMISRGVI